MSGDALPLSGRQPRAIRNTLAVLQHVAAAGPGVTAKEISTELRLASATTYRLLNLLVEEEYLVRMPDLRGFAVGRNVVGLAGPRPVPAVPAAAHAVVSRLRGHIRFGVHLAGYADGHIYFTDPDPDHPPTDAGVLTRHPHASALGKLLLAEGQELPAHLPALTRHTLTTPASLAAELDRVRAEGIAEQRCELDPHHACLAVPVHSAATGRLAAALAVCGTPDRLGDPGTDLVDRLRQCAKELTSLVV
ncbi:IclR family transcriptional regulator C-terminal domain-containing protein [Streptomyces sp. NPDC002088]|uniref:IclR family transcriptional regulator n=1 Tax=Streptomyces sp. NPDC002088 TaxID=3154665 RepID=UPI00332ECAB2